MILASPSFSIPGGPRIGSPGVAVMLGTRGAGVSGKGVGTEGGQARSAAMAAGPAASHFFVQVARRRAYAAGTQSSQPLRFPCSSPSTFASSTGGPVAPTTGRSVCECDNTHPTFYHPGQALQFHEARRRRHRTSENAVSGDETNNPGLGRSVAPYTTSVGRSSLSGMAMSAFEVHAAMRLRPGSHMTAVHGPPAPVLPVTPHAPPQHGGASGQFASPFAAAHHDQQRSDVFDFFFIQQAASKSESSQPQAMEKVSPVEMHLGMLGRGKQAVMDVVLETCTLPPPFLCESAARRYHDGRRRKDRNGARKRKRTTTAPEPPNDNSAASALASKTVSGPISKALPANAEQESSRLPAKKSAKLSLSKAIKLRDSTTDGDKDVSRSLKKTGSGTLICTPSASSEATSPGKMVWPAKERKETEKVGGQRMRSLSPPLLGRLVLPKLPMMARMGKNDSPSPPHSTSSSINNRKDSHGTPKLPVSPPVAFLK